MDPLNRAYSIGAGTGKFPTATEWLTIGGLEQYFAYGNDFGRR